MTNVARVTRAIRIHRAGGPEAMVLDEVELPPPSAHEVLVRNSAAGINFIDIHQRAGRYPLPSFPVTLGMEGAGAVEAVGEAVTAVQVGDRVSYAAGGHGGVPCTYAEYSLVAAERLILLPEEISDETGAAMTLKGLTAQYLLRGSYVVNAGDTIVVHAAAGGVGLLLCQWARHLGVRVIGTVGSDDKAQLALDHGCDHVVLYRQENLAERVRALTGGEGVPVVYDAVGKDTFESSLACLKVRGMLVCYGTASGPIPPFDLFRLNVMGSLSVTSAGLAWFTRSRPELLARAAELIDVVTRGVVKVPVRQKWPLAEAADAHRMLESRATSGMSVLTI